MSRGFLLTSKFDKDKFPCKMVAMKEKDPIANAVKEIKEFKVSDEAAEALCDYLKKRKEAEEKVAKKVFKRSQKNLQK